MKNIKLSIITFFALLLFISCSNNPTLIKTMILNEISNPHEIISDGKHLIISDGIEGTSIYVYALDDLSLFSQFGGTGDKTGKFIVSGGHSVGMDIRNDTLLISSHWKASFFTKDGKLIKEQNMDYDTYSYRFLGDHYQGESDTTENNIVYYTFNRYDKNFKFIKEITRIKGSTQEGKGTLVLGRKYQGLTHKNRFYFKGKSEDLEVESYNSDGTLENVFKQACERLLVEEEHINDVYRVYKEHPFFGKYFESIKPRLFFPEYLPAIYLINVVDDDIYALTYDTDSTGTVMYKMALDGKLINKQHVPIQWIGSTDTYPFTISNNHIYQLVKNKSEKWELQIIKL